MVKTRLRDGHEYNINNEEDDDDDDFWERSTDLQWLCLLLLRKIAATLVYYWIYTTACPPAVAYRRLGYSQRWCLEASQLGKGDVQFVVDMLVFVSLAQQFV